MKRIKKLGMKTKKKLFKKKNIYWILIILTGAFIGAFIPIWSLISKKTGIYNIFWGYAIHFIITLLVHSIIYRIVVGKEEINYKLKENITLDFFNKKSLIIFIEFILAIDYMIAEMFKIRLESSKKISNIKEKKGDLIKQFNHWNCWITIIIAICLIKTGEDWKSDSVILYFLFFRIFYRSNEIIIAFYYDIIEKRKTSNLISSDRIKLAVFSMIEIIIINTMLFQVAGINDRLGGNICRSIGLSTLTDVDFTAYLVDEPLILNRTIIRHEASTDISGYLAINNIDLEKEIKSNIDFFEIKEKELSGNLFYKKNTYNGLIYCNYSDIKLFKGYLDIRFSLILQVITSLVLISMSLSNYISGIKIKSMLIYDEEQEKIEFYEQIERLEKIYTNDKILKKGGLNRINKYHDKFKATGKQRKKEERWCNEYFDIKKNRRKN